MGLFCGCGHRASHFTDNTMEDDHSGNTHLDTTAAAQFETPRILQPKNPTPETTPTKLRNEITELKSNNIAEQEEVLKFHQKLFSEGDVSRSVDSFEHLVSSEARRWHFHRPYIMSWFFTPSSPDKTRSKK